MSKRVYNFSAGPAMLPTSVMEEIQQEFMDYQGMGASVIEISHRSPEFMEILDRTDTLITELMELPKEYAILYVHGGARMQFAALPMNLLGRSPSKTAIYFNSGNFANLSIVEAQKFGKVYVAGSSETTKFDRIPEFDISTFPSDAAYVHLTSNNTIYGTQWKQFPTDTHIPVIMDMTSELLSRRIDYRQFGGVYAGLQKNLGPSGMTIVILKKELLQTKKEKVPSLLDYAVYEEKHSLANTTNTFAIYVMMKVLEWIKAQGGIDVIEANNNKKAQYLYDAIDQSDFYQGVVLPEHRSCMNATFHLAKPDLQNTFLSEALEHDLYALKGHRLIGGIRASIYNAMPIEGVQTLVEFMNHFEQKYG